MIRASQVQVEYYTCCTSGLEQSHKHMIEALLLHVCVCVNVGSQYRCKLTQE